jgi:hypothetical protein
MKNLVGAVDYAGLQKKLAGMLQSRLRQTGDKFHSKQHYLEEWGYSVDQRGAIPYFFQRKKQDNFKVQSPMYKSKQRHRE